MRSILKSATVGIVALASSLLATLSTGCAHGGCKPHCGCGHVAACARAERVSPERLQHDIEMGHNEVYWVKDLEPYVADNGRAYYRFSFNPLGPEYIPPDAERGSVAAVDLIAKERDTFASGEPATLILVRHDSVAVLPPVVEIGKR